VTNFYHGGGDFDTMRYPEESTVNTNTNRPENLESQRITSPPPGVAPGIRY